MRLASQILSILAAVVGLILILLFAESAAKDQATQLFELGFGLVLWAQGIQAGLHALPVGDRT